MKNILLYSVLLTLCLFGAASAQGDDPTVNISMLSVGSGTITDYLDSRSGAAQSCQSLLQSTQRNNDMVPASNDSFICLADALETAGMMGLLDGEGPFTLFAPSDQAFYDAADEIGLDVDNENNFMTMAPDVLTALLGYHVLNEGRSLRDIYVASEAGAMSMYTDTTSQGTPLVIGFPSSSAADDGMTPVMVGDDAMLTSVGNVTPQAFVNGATIQVDNGYIIPIDTVLMPPVQ